MLETQKSRQTLDGWKYHRVWLNLLFILIQCIVGNKLTRIYLCTQHSTTGLFCQNLLLSIQLYLWLQSLNETRVYRRKIQLEFVWKTAYWTGASVGGWRFCRQNSPGISWMRYWALRILRAWRLVCSKWPRRGVCTSYLRSTTTLCPANLKSSNMMTLFVSAVN